MVSLLVLIAVVEVVVEEEFYQEQEVLQTVVFQELLVVGQEVQEEVWLGSLEDTEVQVTLLALMHLEILLLGEAEEVGGLQVELAPMVTLVLEELVAKLYL